jgi:hypothetical protein
VKPRPVTEHKKKLNVSIFRAEGVLVSLLGILLIPPNILDLIIFS